MVHEALHEVIGRRASVKVLQETGDQTSSQRRFLTEARAVSLVQHPGMVRIFDFAQLGTGRPYILMELVEGELLRARLERGNLAIASALRIARQIASALAAAHARGIVHRDLKPENVMLVRDDETAGGERVKLLDFGIARLSGDDRVHTTTEGVVLGTRSTWRPSSAWGTRTSTTAPTSTRSASCCTSCSRASLPSAASPPPSCGSTCSRWCLRSRHRARSPTTFTRCCGGCWRRSPRAGRAWRRWWSHSRPWSRAPLSPSRSPAESPEGLRSSTGAATVAGRRTPFVAPRRSRRLWAMAAGGAALVALAASAWLGLRARERPQAFAPTLEGMVRLPGGRFRMGSTPEELEAECAGEPKGCTPETRKRLERELPAHDVTVSSFQLDRYEVTHAQLAAFLSGVAPSLDVREDRDDHRPRFVYDRASGLLFADLYPRASGLERTANGRFAVRAGWEKRPMVQVTWDGASRYCQSLGKRLPTEAEWEYAARGTSRRRYPWGDEAPRCEGVLFGRSAGSGCERLPAETAEGTEAAGAG